MDATTKGRTRGVGLRIGLAAVAVAALVAVALPVAGGGDAAASAPGSMGHPGECRQLVQAVVTVDGVLDELATAGTLAPATADAVRQAIRERISAEAGAGAACPGLLARVELVRQVGDVLGLSFEELRQRFAGGESLAEMAADQGVERAEVVVVFADALNERLDAMLDDGRISQEERDALAVLGEGRIERLVDHHLGDRGRFGAEPGPDASPAATEVD